jgi:hypothetical protein
MGFWLEHFEGVTLKDITEAKIYAAVSRMQNRKAKEIWQQRVEAAKRKGKEAPVFEPSLSLHQPRLSTWR